MAETTSDYSPCRLAACVLAAWLLVSSSRLAPGADEAAVHRHAKTRRPTAAFLDLDGSPLAGLLEQRLLENTAYRFRRTWKPTQNGLPMPSSCPRPATFARYNFAWDPQAGPCAMSDAPQNAIGECLAIDNRL